MNRTDDQDSGNHDETSPSPRSRRLLRARVLVPVIVVVAAVAAFGIRAAVTRGPNGAAADPPHPDSSVAGTPTTVGTDVCGEGWKGGKAGPQTFALWNNSIEALEVYLQDVTTKKVYLDVENLGSTATRSASVDLAPGSYRFFCIPAESDPVTGATEKVAGTYTGAITPGVQPVTNNDLAPALARYLDWVRGQLPALKSQVSVLADDLQRGDVAAAKRDWLTAHLHYETLGAAYDAFGDDDDAINELPQTTVPAAKDKHLTGFHRIEGLLWSGAPTSEAVRPARQLVKAVGRLRTDLATPKLQTQEIGLRAHEILENAIQFELTGRSDAGSHTGLATIDANLTGTVRTLGFIKKLLVGRDPDLAVTERDIAASQRYVRSLRHGDTWIPLDDLSQTQREKLDALLEDTVEKLSEVAVITDPRKNAGDTP